MARTVATLRLVTAAAVSAISHPSPTLSQMVSTTSSICRPSRSLFTPSFQVFPSFSLYRGYARGRSRDIGEDLDDSDFEPSDFKSGFDPYDADAVPSADDDDDGAYDDTFDDVDDDDDDDDDDKGR